MLLFINGSSRHLQKETDEDKLKVIIRTCLRMAFEDVRKRSAAQGVIDEEDDNTMDGPAALTDITVANYSTLTSFLSEAFSPSVPGYRWQFRNG